jgi:hypothetical protein
MNDGSGSNSKPGSDWIRFRISSEGISGILAVRPLSLAILNCPFLTLLIFSANSMQPITTAAGSKTLQTQHWRIRCFTDGGPVDHVVQVFASPNPHPLGNSPHPLDRQLRGVSHRRP